MTAEANSSIPTVAEYLAAVDARYEPITAESEEMPAINCFAPQGWQRVSRQVFPHAFGVWAQPVQPGSNWADNATLLVGRLTGAIDPMTLIRCTATDSRRMPQWHEINYETGTFDGFPSAAITGTYVVEAYRFWSHTRYLLVRSRAGCFWIQLTTTARARTDAAPPPTTKLIVRIPPGAEFTADHETTG
ncbi:LpqN/LpqT family lipoprotein [Nocardia sp. NPDC059240]|uniref:LpqN/LpqT family lipoprotein n=1 Tax=Nocardia sp. NPDC059240 TaxID=3346786 RepID=UPI0036BB5418